MATRWSLRLKRWDGSKSQSPLKVPSHTILDQGPVECRPSRGTEKTDDELSRIASAQGRIGSRSRTGRHDGSSGLTRQGTIGDNPGGRVGRTSAPRKPSYLCPQGFVATAGTG